MKKRIKNLLVIGAGATLAEAKGMKLSNERTPPLISNFMQKTSQLPLANIQSYIDFLCYIDKQKSSSLKENFLVYLTKQREKTEKGKFLDILPFFINLEKEKIITIEDVFAFAWKEKDKNPLYEDSIYQAIIRPFSFILADGLLDWKQSSTPVDIEHGSSTFKLPSYNISQKVANILEPNDCVLSLNYDNTFEFALKQLRKEFYYVGFQSVCNEIGIIKPHGSFNFYYHKQKDAYMISEPFSNFGIQPGNGAQNIQTIMPPRLNKNFEQHPLARIVISGIPFEEVENIIFWGIGFTQSDEDLNELYKNWRKKSRKISIINPDSDVSIKCKNFIGGNVFHYNSIENFLSNDGIKVKL